VAKRVNSPDLKFVKAYLAKSTRLIGVDARTLADRHDADGWRLFTSRAQNGQEIAPSVAQLNTMTSDAREALSDAEIAFIGAGALCVGTAVCNMGTRRGLRSPYTDLTL